MTAQGAVEKDLTLALARGCKPRARAPAAGARRAHARGRSRDLTSQERAERANRRARRPRVCRCTSTAAGRRARAASPRTARRRRTAPTATSSASGGASTIARAGAVARRGDRATRSRAASWPRPVLSALELRGLRADAAARVLPYPLLGVNAPGLMLECATLHVRRSIARACSGRRHRRPARRRSPTGIEAYGESSN